MTDNFFLAQIGTACNADGPFYRDKKTYLKGGQEEKEQSKQKGKEEEEKKKNKKKKLG